MCVKPVRAAPIATAVFATSLATTFSLACAPSPDRRDERREQMDDWIGEVSIHVVNHGDRSELLHRLRVFPGEAGQSIRPLLLPPDAQLDPGSRIRVWGRSQGDAIQVVRHEVLPGLPADDSGATTSRASALIAGEKKPTRRWAFVLLDVDGGGNPINKVTAQDALFSPNRPDSIRSYFREVSYGLQDLDGEVFGPFPYAMNGRCDTDRIVEEMLAKIPGKFNQYLWFFGKPQRACQWAGIADLGKADRPAKHSWYNAAHNCALLVQEPGHNFGMVHSAAIHCTQAGKRVPIAWPPEQPGVVCSNEEYGNPFDPMGGGDCYHMNGVQKAYQDWLAGCNIVKATTSGTFTIYPLASTCDGPQLLHIPFPSSRAIGSTGALTGYYLELRAPVGYRDQDLSPQVLVIVGNDIREGRFFGNRNWLVDMTPETATVDDGALPVGKRYEDTLPGGPKFTLLSVDASKAVIKVELGGSTADPSQPGSGVCSDMTAFKPPGPTACVTPAAPPPTKAPVPDAGAPATDAGPTAQPDSAPSGMQDPGSGRPPEGGFSSPPTGGARPGRDAATTFPPAPPDAPARTAGGCHLTPAAGPTSPSAPALLGLLLLGLGLARRRRHR